MAFLSYAVQLTQDLVKCPSVTPAEGGALDLLENLLTGLGFDCTRLPFGEGEAQIDNLFARIGTSHPHIAFAGHTDVVPAGDIAAWSSDPFAGEIRHGQIYRRGTADMKGGIAAFVALQKAILKAANYRVVSALSSLVMKRARHVLEQSGWWNGWKKQAKQPDLL